MLARLVQNFQLGFMLLTCSIVSVQAQELLIARGDANYAPHEMVVDGELSGFHIELVRAVARDLDIRVVYKSYPWKRAVDMARRGTADAVSYIGENVERSKFLYFAEGNVLSSVNYVFVICERDASRIRYEGDVSRMMSPGYKLIVQRGYSYGPVIDNADYIEKYVVDRVSQLGELLRSGRFKVAMLTSAEFYSDENKEHLQETIMLDPPVYTRNVYLAFSKKAVTKAAAERFSEAMFKFKKTDVYQSLRDKYGIKG